MDFYTIVSGIALIILIIILIVVGVMIYQTKYNIPFPPSALVCPNYWMNGQDTNGSTICYIPTNGINSATFTNANTAGLGSNEKGSYINFNDSNWGKNSFGSTCTKYYWANKNNILWDGISNYNGCPSAAF